MQFAGGPNPGDDLGSTGNLDRGADNIFERGVEHDGSPRADTALCLYDGAGHTAPGATNSQVTAPAAIANREVQGREPAAPRAKARNPEVTRDPQSS